MRKNILRYTKLKDKLSFKTINPKVVPHNGDKYLTHATNHRKENQILKTETVLLTIFSKVCKSDMKEVHSNTSNPLLKCL